MAITYHASWQPFFTKARLSELENILQAIGDSITPPKENVLFFLQNDVQSIRCVIMGQDPYFQTFVDEEGRTCSVATGRAFEVNGLTSWLEPFNNTSLKNIVRLIYKAYYGELILFTEIREKIRLNRFPLVPPDSLFKNLESQGVLLLNRSLSCELYKPNSHKELWANWTRELIEYLSSYNPSIHWFLWGKESQKVAEYIKDGKIHKANHPRLNNRSNQTDFLNSTCFEVTKDLVNWCG